MIDKPTLGAFSALCLKVGCLGFGGPAGQLALMQTEFIDKRGWIEPSAYQQALALCTLIPGPEAQQVATWIGWRLHGVVGGLIAGLLFVIPGALAVFALSCAYVMAPPSALAKAMFIGLQAGVLAVILDAIVKLSRRTLKRRVDWVIAAAAFAGLAVFHVPYPILIGLVALIGWWLRAGVPPSKQDASSEPVSAPKTWMTIFVWAGVWLMPLALVAILLGPDHVLTQIGTLFATVSATTFGGAYGTLAFLNQTAVAEQGWLSAGQLMEGFALTEAVPGPLVLTNQFVGFMAGWKPSGTQSGMQGNLGLAAAGALIASWQTFAPSFLWVFAGAPHAPRLLGNKGVIASLAAIMAAVIGVVTALAIQFGAHLLIIDAPVSGVFVPLVPLLIAVAACVAFIRFKINVLIVLASCALAGVLAHIFGLASHVTLLL